MTLQVSQARTAPSEANWTQRTLRAGGRAGPRGLFPARHQIWGRRRPKSLTERPQTVACLDHRNPSKCRSQLSATQFQRAAGLNRNLGRCGSRRFATQSQRAACLHHSNHRRVTRPMINSMRAGGTREGGCSSRLCQRLEGTAHLDPKPSRHGRRRQGRAREGQSTMMIRRLHAEGEVNFFLSAWCSAIRHAGHAVCLECLAWIVPCRGHVSSTVVQFSCSRSWWPGSSVYSILYSAWFPA